jgi:NADPH:quinone reductase-like Zn-dependent oxidoreductase
MLTTLLKYSPIKLDSAFFTAFQTYQTLRAVLFSLLHPLLPRLFVDFGEFPARPTNAVLITGCSTGIGRGAALYLASKGYMVFAGVRKDTDIKSLLKEYETTEKKGTFVLLQ